MAKKKQKKVKNKSARIPRLMLATVYILPAAVLLVSIILTQIYYNSDTDTLKAACSTLTGAMPYITVLCGAVGLITDILRPIFRKKLGWGGAMLILLSLIYIGIGALGIMIDSAFTA